MWRRLGGVDGFMEGASVFAEDDSVRAYFVNGTQVAAMEGDRLAVRLTRKVITAERELLRGNELVERRSKSSDWVMVDVSVAEGVELAVRLASLAADAHRPPPGVAMKPPPEGAELARRRRFH